jgi:hypothetical protein
LRRFITPIGFEDKNLKAQTQSLRCKRCAGLSRRCQGFSLKPFLKRLAIKPFLKRLAA